MPDSGERPGYDDLSFELNQLHQCLAGQARGGDPLAMRMPAVTGAVSRRMLGVPAWLEDAPATVVIMARTRARRLNAAVGDALRAALSIRDYACAGDPELALPGVSAISVALEQARDHLAGLGPGFSLEGLDLDHDISLAVRLTGVLARSASFDARKASDLRGALLTRLRDARFTVSDLALALDGVPVDACGADLSGLGVRRLGDLHGVTWTSETTWPPAIAAQVRAHSTQDQPGRYTIRVPCTRGQAQPTP